MQWLGQSRSPAKRRASRINGALAGRERWLAQRETVRAELKAASLAHAVNAAKRKAERIAAAESEGRRLLTYRKR